MKSKIKVSKIDVINSAKYCSLDMPNFISSILKCHDINLHKDNSELFQLKFLIFGN